MKIMRFFAGIILAAAFLGLGATANAQSSNCVSLPTEAEKISCLSEIINQLTAQITQLLAVESTVEKGGGQPNWHTPGYCHTFNQNLGFAQSGSAEISYLHRYLQNEGFSYLPDGDKDYTEATSAAVKRFQGKYHIMPQSGYVGSVTRAKLNQLYGCNDDPPVNTGTTTNTNTGTTTNTNTGTTTNTNTATALLRVSVPQTPAGAGCSIMVNGISRPCSQESISVGSVFVVVPSAVAGYTYSLSGDCILSSGAIAGRTYNCSITYSPTTVVPPMISVVSPNVEIQDWQLGTTHEIIWSATNITGNVRITLLDSLNRETYIATVLAASSTYTWDLPRSATFMPAGTYTGSYRVKISGTGSNGAAVERISNQFRISANQTTIGGVAPTVTLLANSSPNATITVGEAVTLTWTSQNATSCHTDGGWGNQTVATSGSRTVTPTQTTTYYITCSNSTNQRAQGTTIVSVSPNFTGQLSINSPLSGSSWVQGTAQTIRWETSPAWALTTSVNISLINKTTGVSTYLAYNQTRSGSYIWNIPASMQPGIYYLQFVGYKGSERFWNQNSVDFNIIAPLAQSSITVQSPQSGASIGQSANYTIRWSSMGATGNVDIDLVSGSSTNNTISVISNIARNVPISNGSYLWSVPGTTPIGTNYKVAISVAGGTGIPLRGLSGAFSVTRQQVAQSILIVNIVGAPSSGGANVSLNGAAATNYTSQMSFDYGTNFAVTAKPVSGFTASLSGTCSNTSSAGNMTYTCNVNYVPAAGTFSLDVSISPTTVNNGETATLNWTTVGASNCKTEGMTDYWLRAQGPMQLGAITRTQTYTVTCLSYDRTRTLTKSATVTVGSAPNPVISLTANPQYNIPYGGSTTISWTISNLPGVGHCMLDTTYSTIPLSGTQQVTNLVENRNFTVSCRNADNILTTKSVSITVNPPSTPVGAITLRFTSPPTGQTWRVGETRALTWDTNFVGMINVGILCSQNPSGTISSTPQALVPASNKSHSLSLAGLLPNSSCHATISTYDHGGPGGTVSAHDQSGVFTITQ